MALRNGAELADFAAAKSVAQPINVTACDSAPPRRTATHDQHAHSRTTAPPSRRPHETRGRTFGCPDIHAA